MCSENFEFHSNRKSKSREWQERIRFQSRFIESVHKIITSNCCLVIENRTNSVLRMIHVSLYSYNWPAPYAWFLINKHSRSQNNKWLTEALSRCFCTIILRLCAEYDCKCANQWTKNKICTKKSFKKQSAKVRLIAVSKQKIAGSFIVPIVKRGHAMNLMLALI